MEGAGDKQVFIIGSLRPEDDDTILPFINSNAKYKFIIAPHEITEKHISKIESVLHSTVRHSLLAEENNSNTLILDSIGKLSRLYRLANYAYIGGGFSDGIHNILEPAVYNIPVFFGDKYYKKYKEATDLVDFQAAFAIANTADLVKKVKDLEDPVQLAKVCEQIKNYVDSNLGASKKAVSIINKQTTR